MTTSGEDRGPSADSVAGPRQHLRHAVILLAAFAVLLLTVVAASPASAARYRPKRPQITTLSVPARPAGPTGPALRGGLNTQVGAPWARGLTGRTARGRGVGGATGPRRPKARAAGSGTGTASTLILYDSTGPFAFLGELYATMTANLASHFGSWTAQPVASYTAGQVENYTATIYLGSTYDEAPPNAFLDDVLRTAKPVIWSYDNIWRLTDRDPTFLADYGWMWSSFDACPACPNPSPVTRVRYRGQVLTRSSENGGGIMNYSSLDPSKVQVLATAEREDGTSFPWAIRSRNLTYIGESPYPYFSEGDRIKVFEDLLFDALAPATPVRRRALVRLEDISPASDPADLRADADYLSSRGVPFGFGVSARYKDPTGIYNGGVAENVPLRRVKAVVDAIKYMQARGGTMVQHGWTHQYDSTPNPYSAVTADDFEFYRVTENADSSITYRGPVPRDSEAWAQGRVDGARADFKGAGLTAPTIFEFPHYAGSIPDSKVMARNFASRWERSLYTIGALTGGTPDYQRLTGQMFPYVVRDVYGQKVLPESLGNIDPVGFGQFPPRLPANIIANAQRQLAVRDNVAGFFFHPFLDISFLKQTVEGMQALGYTFVAPGSL